MILHELEPDGQCRGDRDDAKLDGTSLERDIEVSIGLDLDSIGFALKKYSHSRVVQMEVRARS